MRANVIATVCVLAFCGWAILGTDAAPEGATYIKNAMCVACHKARDKDLVERYQATKHAQATIADDAKPVDIYRRVVGFQAADNSCYEAGVGCQTCHGPGSAHMKAKTPEDKQAAIVRPQTLETPRQKLSVCGRCHGDYTVAGKPFAEGFKAGDDLFALPEFKLNEITTPGPFQQLNELESSKHGEHDVTCLTCHTSHEPAAAAPQLRKAVPALCLECHADAHKCTVAADKVPEGATCATCHMPGGRHIFKVVK